jgi:hypothetical protein
VVAALGSLVGARFAREWAKDEAPNEGAEEPYAPSKSTAPFVSIGYRELVADLLFIRLAGYFGGTESTANGIASLVEAIIALDPKYQRVYDYGAGAITIARSGVDNDALFRAIAVLEHGRTEFPNDWKLPYREGEIYLHDLQTKDRTQRRAWDEKAALLLESATRKPGASVANTTMVVTALFTQLGRRERAIAGLEEMLLLTNDQGARDRIIKKLAELDNADVGDIAIEMLDQKKRFEKTWLADRPTVPATMYILLGPPLSRGFDLGELATGGHDVIGSQVSEHLDPLEGP